MNRRAKDIGNHFFRILNKVIAKQKQPGHYGIDEKLYHSEIHTIMAIGDHEGVYLSELARMTGVTRGAISQMISRLDEKGLVRKEADQENSLKIRLFLSSKGTIAYKTHENQHDEIDAEILAYVAGVSEEEFTTVQTFLTKFEALIDRHQ